MRRRQLVIAAAAVLAACGEAARPAFKAIDISGADYGRGFQLPDLDGRPRSLADWKGEVVVLFFGFTHCPDVCPATMAELADVKRRLGPDGARLRGVFVTVDPERDTPALLRNYVQAFDPGFVALRGTPEQTLAAAQAFKAYFKKAPASGSDYSVDHTAGSYLVDPQGRVRLFTRYGSGADALLHDVKLLLAGA